MSFATRKQYTAAAAAAASMMTVCAVLTLDHGQSDVRR